MGACGAAARETVSAHRTYRCIRVHHESRFEVVHYSAAVSPMQLRQVTGGEQHLETTEAPKAECLGASWLLRPDWLGDLALNFVLLDVVAHELVAGGDANG